MKYSKKYGQLNVARFGFSNIPSTSIIEKVIWPNMILENIALEKRFRQFKSN